MKEKYRKKKASGQMPGSRIFYMVPKAGLEPARSCLRQILSLLRLPFRHSGAPLTHFFAAINGKPYRRTNRQMIQFNHFRRGCPDPLHQIIQGLRFKDQSVNVIACGYPYFCLIVPLKIHDILQTAVIFDFSRVHAILSFRTAHYLFFHYIPRKPKVNDIVYSRKPCYDSEKS